MLVKLGAAQLNLRAKALRDSNNARLFPNFTARLALVRRAMNPSAILAEDLLR
jgi:hypothetical protein